jgi:3-isopropylmalate/(R)-2-methylmalate dehydratase small subunit
MASFQKLTSRVVVLPEPDIDTDQIIPARFLKAIDKQGMGAHLFADWRSRPGFPLLAPDADGAQILVAGDNFGCGSSREHAPWALHGWGFRAILAPSFADIFRGNALKNGLLPVAIPKANWAQLVEARAADPKLEVTVDLGEQTVSLVGESVRFEVDRFARHCLLNGFDELDYLLSLTDRIVAHEA